MATQQIHWHVGVTDTRPLWTTVPDVSMIEAISRPHLFPHADNLTGELTVTFLAEGAFNKVYAVDAKTTPLLKSYVFRASLPIEPGDKVRNEAATLAYIKRHTKIPVPAVVAYESSSENDLGFEWILMERIPGVQLSEIWPSLSNIIKSSLTRDIGDYIVQMRRNCVFPKIGGLYHDGDHGFIVGPIITQFLFMGPRRQLIPRNRGPYEHDSAFARALVDVQIADVHLLNTMPSTDPRFDPDVFEDGPDILHAMNELLSLIPIIFPKDEKNEPFHTTLQHPDLSLANIMVDPTTLNITGIIDWECTNASPQWEHPYPQFLMGPEVKEEPPRVEPGDTDPVRNEHWDTWEKMHLRKVFDEVAGHLVEEPLAVLKREFVYHLGVAEYSPVMVMRWAKTARDKKGKGNAKVRDADAGESWDEKKDRITELIKQGRLAEVRKEIFGKGLLGMLEKVRSNWVETLPKFSDMPKDWLDGDLSSGLEEKHLYPDIYKTNLLGERNPFGVLKERD